MYNLEAFCMKRIVSALLACLLLLGLTACGAATEQPTETQAITEPAEPEFTTQAVEADYTTQVVDVAFDPNFDAEALFKRLEGVWDAPRPEFEGTPWIFRSFIYEDGKPYFYCGAYEGGTPGPAALTGGRENADGTVTLYFLYPAFNDEDNNPYPERTDSLQIDLTNIGNGTLRVRQTNIWRTYDWETCTYRCKTLREAGLRLY